MLRVSAWLSSTQVATAGPLPDGHDRGGFVVGVRAAGVYAVGQFLFIAVDRFIRPSLTGSFPCSPPNWPDAATPKPAHAMALGTRIALAVAGRSVLAAILLAGPFVHAWVGPGYGDARLVVVYLVSALLLATVSRTGPSMLQDPDVSGRRPSCGRRRR